MALTKISTAMISQSAAAVDLNVDAGTFYVDTTNNRVGVGGKTDPDTPLHVVGTATATLFAGSGASLTSIPNSALVNSSITINSTAVSLGGSLTLTTANIAENTNLYYTNARADARIAAADTDDLSEGSSNLYYTDARVDARVSGGSLGNITTTGYIRGPATFTIDPAAHGDNTGTVVIAGNLQVDGTQTVINSTTLTVDDKNITLASGSANAAAASGAGFTVDIGTGTNPAITYDGTNDEWDFNKPLNVTGNIAVSGTVDGVDIAARDAVLTSTTTTAGAALPKAGGTMTGALTVKSPSATGEQLILKIENAVSTGAIGKITFNQTNDEMHLSNEATGSLVFDIATVEKMRIDSLGNVLFGNGNSYSPKIQGTTNSGRTPGSPGYSFNDDLDTGMFHPLGTPNTVAFSTGGTERLRIKSDGNVGIGNTNPQTNLTIGSAQGNSLEFTYDSTNGYRNIISNHWNSSTDTRMDFNIGRTGNVAPVPVMSVGYGGNVGIGTTSPNFMLHINKGTSSYAPTDGVNENVFGINTSYNTTGTQGATFSRLDGNWVDGISGADSAFGWLWHHENNVRGGLVYDHRGTERMQLFSSYAALAFITPNATDGNGVPTDSNMVERLTILPGGNVGINDTTPNATLDIVNNNVAQVTLNVQPPGSGDSHVAQISRGSGSHKGSGLKIAGANYTNGTNTNAAFLELAAGSYSGSNTKYIHAYDNSGTGFMVGGDGKVGIGIANPAAKLHIHETVSSGTGIMLTNGANTAGTYSDIMWQYSATDSSYGSGIRFKQVDTNHGGQIELWTDNSVGTATQRMTINKSGYVGIGTDTPDSLLEIHKSSTNLDIDYLKMSMPSWSQSTSKLKSMVWDDSSNVIAGIGAEFDGGKTNIHFHSQYNGGYKANSVRTMSILGNGNVGIGIAAPAHKLHVHATSPSEPLGLFQTTSSGDCAVRIEGIGGEAYLEIANTSASTGNTSNSWGIGCNDDTNLHIAYGTNSTMNKNSEVPQFYINSSTGNVGVGTANPDATLHVNGAAIIGGNRNNYTTPAAGLHILDDTYSKWSTTLSPEQCALRVETYWNGSDGHPRAAGDYGGGIVFNHLGGHSTVHGKNMHCWIGPRIWDLAGHERAGLVFATNDDGSTTPSAGVTTIEERMVIDPYGNVGIGISPAGYETSGYALRLDGGAQTYLSWNNNTHTTQVLGGFHIGNDSAAARIIQRENQPIVFYTNDTTAMTIAGDGIVTKPMQPAFSAYANTNETTAAGGIAPFDALIFDQGSNYTTSTRRFTAPVAGIYHFSTYSNINGVSTGNAMWYAFAVNGAYRGAYMYQVAPTSSWNWLGGSQTIKLAQGDYVQVKSGTSMHWDMGNAAWSNFSGHLVG